MNIFKVTVHYGRKLPSGTSEIIGYYNVPAKDDLKARKKAMDAFNKSNEGEGVVFKFCETEFIGTLLD